MFYIYYIVIKMKPSINLDKKDPKICLLTKILKHFDDRTTKQIISRNNIKNINLMTDCIKIILMTMYFDYTISEMIREINRNEKVQKQFKIQNNLTEQQFYEYFSRFDANIFNNITNSMCLKINKTNRKPIKTFLVDATPVAVDINTIKKYISKEELAKLNLKWGFSKTKLHYIGFKVTVILDKDTLCPISIIIHPGSPHDSVIYNEVLSELKRRKLLAKRTLLYFDRGYYSLENYKIGINRYKIVPVIAPKYSNTIQKIKDNLAYPLDIYKNTNLNQFKKEYQILKTILIQQVENWDNLKPIRGLIEDFFKVAKDAFGLGKFHKYTTKSVSKSIYLCILLTTLCIQQGFMTKTKMQQLSEGNIEGRPAIKHRRKKKTKNSENNTNTSVPQTTKQTTISDYIKNKQKTLFDY